MLFRVVFTRLKETNIYVDIHHRNNKLGVKTPSACAELIDLFEQELSLTQTIGLEYLAMGDINIDYKLCLNNKWTNLTK